MKFHFHPSFALSIVATLAVRASAQSGSPVPPIPALPPDAQISAYVRKVFQDRDGGLWFGTNDDGACHFDGRTLTCLSVENGLAGRAIRAILQDDTGAMWFATDGGVSRFDNGKFTNFTEANGLPDSNVWSLMQDRSGTIWVGTLGGVCRLEGESFVPFPIPRAEVESPSSRFSPLLVWSMHEGRDGNIWFGTDGEGARRFDGTSFTTYTAKDGLAGDQVGCIVEDRLGRIWLGAHSGGVSCYDGTAFRNYGTKDGLSDGAVWTMLEDRDGHLWISTLGNGVSRFDGASFTAYGAKDGLTRSHVQSILQDRSGTLWFGCSGGLFRLDGTTFINVTRNGPWPSSSAAPTDTESGTIETPMSTFARFVAGEWQVTAASGTSMFHAWTWGPGRFSIRRMTDGRGAAGQPWRELMVFYWHAARKQIRLLGVSPYARGVSEGTITFEGDRAEAVVDLYQSALDLNGAGVHRKMGLRWEFDGPDSYLETLLESTQTGELSPLASWKHVRIPPNSATRRRTPDSAAKPTEHLKAFDSLLGHSWRAKGDGLADIARNRTEGTVKSSHITTSFEWVPQADALCARVVEHRGTTQLHLLDAFIYHHTGKNALQCLALSDRGAMFEGDVIELEGGSLQLDLESHEGDGVVRRIARVDFEQNGRLRFRLWSVDGDDRTLELDLDHSRVEPANGEQGPAD